MAAETKTFVSVHNGTGEEHVHKYVSVRNAIKFGLRKPAVPAGSFDMFQRTEQGDRFLFNAYKTV